MERFPIVFLLFPLPVCLSDYRGVEIISCFDILKKTRNIKCVIFTDDSLSNIS